MPQRKARNTGKLARAIKRIACAVLLPGFLLPVMSSALETSSMITYDRKTGSANTGAIDFSWMNDMPAGAHGRVVVNGSDFAFEDGTSARFFGVDLGFAAAVPEKSVAESYAAELAASGVNLARLHAFDCYYGANCGILDFTGYENGEVVGEFVAEALDKFDYLVYCLKQKGIYVQFEVSAGRKVSTADGFTQGECEALNTAIRGYNFLDGRVCDIVTNYAVELLNHVNPYTGMKYADDPVLAVLQYCNEASVFWVSSDDAEGSMQRATQLRFNRWLLDKYGDRAGLLAAWTDAESVTCLESSEDPAEGTVNGVALPEWSEPVNQWMDSQSPRHADFVSFLTGVSENAFDKFREAVRNTGYLSAINSSNYPMGPAELYLCSRGDVTERNSYWNAGESYTLPYKIYSSAVFSTIPSGDTSHISVNMSNGASADKPVII